MSDGAGAKEGVRFVLPRGRTSFDSFAPRGPELFEQAATVQSVMPEYGLAHDTDDVDWINRLGRKWSVSFPLPHPDQCSKCRLIAAPASCRSRSSALTSAADLAIDVAHAGESTEQKTRCRIPALNGAGPISIIEHDGVCSIRAGGSIHGTAAAQPWITAAMASRCQRGPSARRGTVRTYRRPPQPCRAQRPPCG
jgi:hypothetical protein